MSVGKKQGVALAMCWLVGVLGYAQEEIPSEGTYKCIFHNNLIYFSVPISDTDSLLFYTDTGGKNYIHKSGLKKLGIAKGKEASWRSELKSHFEEGTAPIHGLDEMTYFRESSVIEDGMLGREWFGKGVWHFDYEKQRIHALGPDLIYPRDIASLLMFFKKDELGKPVNHLARTFVYIDGETLSLLFDTGAQVNLSESAQEQLDSDPLIATSFINASIFDRWRKEHPEWKVYEDADVTFKEPEDIIIVPSIYVGPRKIGPVAFTRREDFNFKTMSAYFMDKTIVGALGGNALSQLGSFVVDYQAEQIILK